MRKILIVLSFLVALPAFAVEPDEILSDPALEARARELSKGLRCLVCRNESIDESNAGLARDLRLLVRERLVAGDSDAEAIDFIVDRYGEYVLLKPRATGSSLLLWLVAPAFFVIGLGAGIAYLRTRRDAPENVPDALSDSEVARLKELMKQ